MKTVNEILYHIKQRSLPNNPLTNPFLQFLSLACEKDWKFNKSLMRTFYAKLMNFNYWLEKQSQTTEAFVELLKSIEAESVDTSFIHQWVPIQNGEDFKQILQQGLQLDLQHSKIVNIEKGVLLIEKRQNHLFARQFRPVAEVRGSQLIPGTEISFLIYDMNLELIDHRPMVLQLTEDQFLYFKSHQGQLSGRILNSHLLLQQRNVNTSWMKEPLLLAPLKRIEKYFIRKESDPFYSRLLEEIETSTHKLQTGQAHAMERARLSLERAYFAMENIYSEDRLLRLSTHNLQHMLNHPKDRFPVDNPRYFDETVPHTKKVDNEWPKRSPQLNKINPIPSRD